MGKGPKKAMAKNKSNSDQGGGAKTDQPDAAPANSPGSMADTLGEEQQSGKSAEQQSTDENGNPIDPPTSAEFTAGCIALIESGTLDPGHLKEIQAAISLSIGPGGANEGASASQSAIQNAISDGPKSEIAPIDFDLTSDIDEEAIGAALEGFAIPVPETKSPGELTDKEIAAELKDIGEPLDVVQECNALWVKMKAKSESESEKIRRVLNLLVHKRTLLEEACMKVQHRSNLLREETAKRGRIAAKAAAEAKLKAKK